MKPHEWRAGLHPQCGDPIHTRLVGACVYANCHSVYSVWVDSPVCGYQDKITTPHSTKDLLWPSSSSFACALLRSGLILPGGSPSRALQPKILGFVWCTHLFSKSHGQPT